MTEKMNVSTNEPVIIYSDGGSDPNPGIGGWGAVLRYGEHEKVLQGNDPHTTNNRMELTAAIEALRALKRPSTVNLYTDSQYLQKGITQWIEGWQAKNWQKKGEPIPNDDLWRQLWDLIHKHDVDWHWVKGHAGDELNERVDRLATAARLEITPETAIDHAVPRLFVRASCLGNPGPGGWAAVVETGDGDSLDSRQNSGWEHNTTNNRMELTAVLEGIHMTAEAPLVQIFTLSDYVFQGATNWINGWRKRNWQKRGGKAVANADLWQKIDAAMKEHRIDWVNAKRLPELPDAIEAAGQIASQAAQEAKNETG